MLDFHHGLLVHLAGLTALERLDLGGTQVTNAGLAHLTGLSALRSLDLGNTQITDTGLEYLAGLPALEFLDRLTVSTRRAAWPDCSAELATLKGRMQ